MKPKFYKPKQETVEKMRVYYEKIQQRIEKKKRSN